MSMRTIATMAGITLVSIYAVNMMAGKPGIVKQIFRG